MKFEYNQDQLAIRDSVTKFLQQEYSFEKRQTILASGSAFRHQVWQNYAEMGWLSLFLSEDVGGFGGSAVDSMMLFEEFGKHLVIEPFLETVLQVGYLLQATSHPLRLTYIDRLMAGEFQGAFAHGEPNRSGFEQAITTTARKCDGGYRLAGIKAVVYNANAADIFIVTAQLGEVKALFLLPSNSPGMNLKSYQTIDGRHAAELELNGVSVDQEDLLAVADEAESLITSVLDNTLLAQTSEMVGCMQVLLETTVEYTKERKQFGVPLSSFQVLQHKMAEMFMATELARSLMYAAAIKLRDATADARAYVAAAKVKADKGARLVAQLALQLHGGMGTSDELKVGHYLKRIEVLIHQLGSTQSHIDRYEILR